MDNLRKRFMGDTSNLLKDFAENPEVLVSDLMPVVRNGIKNLIEADLDMNVEDNISSAENILEYCKTKKPKLIVIDCFLLKEGPEFIKKIKKISPNTNILVLTLEKDPIDVYDAMNSGATGYVLKTAPVEVLMDAISRTMNGETYLAKNMIMRLFQNVSTSEKTGNPYGLSNREMDVLKEISKGKTNKEIATALGISIRTVETHRYNLRSKTDAYTNSKLVKIAKQLGLD